MGCQVLTHRGVRLKSAPEETQPFPSGFRRHRDAPNNRFRAKSKDQIPRLKKGEKAYSQLALLAFDQAASQKSAGIRAPTAAARLRQWDARLRQVPPRAAERDVRKTNTAVTNRRGRTTWRGGAESPVITSAAAAAQALISSFGASARRLCVPRKERRGNESAAFANPDSASLCNNQDEF